MESFQLLLGGFATVLQPTNLIFALLGCVLGTLFGVLPGIGPVTGIAILIPLTFTLDPTPAIIMLAAIYYGANYGGTITSILISVPGEPSTAITCVDGYPMAKQGRGGAALTIAALGSFIGGNIATLALVLVALPLTRLALEFGPAEFFALMVLGLSLVIGLAGDSLVRALLSAAVGLAVAMVGIDPIAGFPRFTFGRTEALGGISVVAMAMGLFGVSDILVSAEGRVRPVVDTKLSSLWITLQDAKDSVWPIVRGSAIGVGLGFIPGVGAIVPTFISYAAEKRLSRHPERFGHGAIEGVAGPETANNAYANAAMIPLFTLGIPASPTIAVMMGAFLINGLIPGPFLFVEHASFVWAVIASLYVGNLMLLVLNLPLIPLWVSLLRIPNSILFALVMGFIIVGAYSLNNSVFDIGVTLGFGVLGYLFIKLDIPLAPAILTAILGPFMEQAMRQTLEFSGGDFSAFFTRPIALALLGLAALVVVSTSFGMISRLRRSDGSG